MENPLFEPLQTVIRQRRTVSVALMNGQPIDDDKVAQLLELADWAPTHGRTEPWRFLVYRKESLQQFAKDHADLYWQQTSEENRDQNKYDKLQQTAEKASHLVVAIMQRGAKPNIPALEEIAATAAAIEHILLGASALGISAIWNTGGMTHHPALKQYLKLGPEDVVMGLIYLGKTNASARPGHRLVPLEEKVKWV